MKVLLLVLTFIFLLHDASFDSQTNSKLKKLLQNDEIDEEQYQAHLKQIEFRAEIGLQRRMDSIRRQGFDILYLEEFSYRKDSFLVLEYYFSSNKERARDGKEMGVRNVYAPDKYFENGKAVSRYFFHDAYAKEHLRSIRDHMKDRKPADIISPIAKKLVMHAGCGMTGIFMKRVEESEAKKYRKPRRPDYFLIETLFTTNEFSYSFQRREKRKFKSIVEGIPF